MRFAASICAQRYIDHNLYNSHSVILIDAVSENEAFGIAMKHVLQMWLTSDNYYNHSAVVVEIPKEEIDENGG